MEKSKYSIALNGQQWIVIEAGEWLVGKDGHYFYSSECKGEIIGFIQLIYSVVKLEHNASRTTD